jgi:hypothetical protein
MGQQERIIPMEGAFPGQNKTATKQKKDYIDPKIAPTIIFPHILGSNSKLVEVKKYE